MKRIVRPLLFGVFLVIVLSIGKNKWIEFRDNTASDRYSQPFYRKATDFFRKVLGVAPFASCHHALAVSYLNEGLEGQAVEEYKKTLLMDKRFAQAYVDLANLYLRRESFKEALEVLEKAESVISGNAAIKDLKQRATFEYSLDAGEKAFEAGDPVGARQFLNNALATGQNSALIHYMIALSFDERQDFYRVEDHLKEAIKADPKFYSARSFLGDVYFGKGDFEKAIEQYQSSLEIHGNDAAVLNNMGLAYMNLEMYDLAILNLEKALALDPSSVEIRHGLAAVYRDNGKLNRAAEGFVDVIRMRPDYPNVHNDLGDIYRKQGRNAEAVREYRASIEYGQKRLAQSPRDVLLLVQLAHAYGEIEEYDRAERLIGEALRIDPRYQKAYWTLANICRSSNRPASALAELEKAQKISPVKYLFIEEAISDITEQMAKRKR